MNSKNQRVKNEIEGERKEKKVYTKKRYQENKKEESKGPRGGCQIAEKNF